MDEGKESQKNKAGEDRTAKQAEKNRKVQGEGGERRSKARARATERETGFANEGSLPREREKNKGAKKG